MCWDTGKCIMTMRSLFHQGWSSASFFYMTIVVIQKAFYQADTVQSASTKNALHTVCREISWRWLLSKLHIIVSSKHRLQPSGCQSKTVVSSSDCSHSELYLSRYVPLWFQWMPFSSFLFHVPVYASHDTSLPPSTRWDWALHWKKNKQNPENFIEWVEKISTVVIWAIS